MIADLKPYPAYRNTGVEPLAQVPSGWEVRRQSNLIELRISNVDKHEVDGERPIRLCNYVDVYRRDRIRADIPFSSGTALDSEVERFRLRREDVLITKDSESWDDIASPALVEHEADDLVCGYHLAILRPRPGLSGAYLFRASQSVPVVGQYQRSASGVTRFGLTRGDIKRVEIPVPPLDDQVAVARFLNHVDSRIQRLTEGKERLIRLLEEEKQGIVHRALTLGLDPSAPLRRSGVDWLGDIPEHWEILDLERMIDLLPGYPFPSAGFSEGEQDIRLLRGVNISPGSIRWDDAVCWPGELGDGLDAYRLVVGDLVLGLDRPIVKAGIRVARITDVDVPSLLLQRVARIRARPGLLSEYVELLLGGEVFRRYIAPIFTGISVPHLSPEQVRRFRIGRPPVDEQSKIVETVAAKTVTLREAIDVAVRQRELLAEYRIRLISDVATGKLDVREAAANLPDDPDADDSALDEQLEGVAAG